MHILAWIKKLSRNLIKTCTVEKLTKRAATCSNIFSKCEVFEKLLCFIKFPNFTEHLSYHCISWVLRHLFRCIGLDIFVRNCLRSPASPLCLILHVNWEQNCRSCSNQKLKRTDFFYSSSVALLSPICNYIFYFFSILW